MNRNNNSQAAGRYSRQMLFPEIGKEGQAKLAAAHVFVAGCGALGTVIADKLARAGVGHIKIVDRDFVELDNLQRQTLFNEEHARKRLPKSVAAAETLRGINSEVEIEAVLDDIAPANVEKLISGCDLVMDGTDNLETRYLINDASIKSGIPWIHGAAVGSFGEEMPVIPGENGCYRCFMAEPPKTPVQGCDVHGVLNSITGMIGAMQSAHALQILTGYPVTGGSLTFADVWENEFFRIMVERRPECPCCVKGDYTFLNSKNTSWANSLCGRNAVQITPPENTEIDLKSLAENLSNIGQISDNGYLLVFIIEPYEMTIFPNGRVIIKGTTDQKVARTLYTRYIGL